MKYLILGVALLAVALGLSTPAQASDKSAATPTTTSKTSQLYPIAPGVWYPGSGELPEKPVRYYRVRCWPGCHRGSSHGKYPDIPLNMKPIFPTSTMDLIPGTGKKSKQEGQSVP
jgi:hypothetical protein